tara:strand:- start:35374 stop:35583 length:210 start_codon:yes stop_codon:yes gene_type:complete
MTVAKARDVAMGLRNCAWTSFSKRSGARPKNVVSEVRRMARNRFTPAAGDCFEEGFPFILKIVYRADED